MGRAHHRRRRHQQHGSREIAGDAAAGYRFISPIMPADIDTPMAKAFLKAYEAKYHSCPAPSGPCSPGTPTTCSSPRSSQGPRPRRHCGLPP